MLLVSLLPLSGCASGTVHPGFALHRPARIAVLPVANATLLPLDKVVFAGVLQRSIVGGEAYDIPRILRGGLEETLVLAGYEVATSESDGDAALKTTIQSWESSSGSAPSFATRFRLELYHLPSGELLYSVDFHCAHRASARSWSEESIEGVVRRCARQALASLPPRSVAPES
jgi:hypothetical protein